MIGKVGANGGTIARSSSLRNTDQSLLICIRTSLFGVLFQITGIYRRIPNDLSQKLKTGDVFCSYILFQLSV